MKVLVSAFKPFNKESNNYSMEVINYINNVDKAIIDVIYDKCYLELSSMYNLDEYDLIIALGEARSRDKLTLETKAYNIASCSLPDNANIIKKDCKIIENVLDELESKLDLNLLSNIVSLSTNPGKFVCNNIYYHLLTNYPSKAIFIHVPHCHDDINEYKKYANEITIIINKIKEQLDK